MCLQKKKNDILAIDHFYKYYNKKMPRNYCGNSLAMGNFVLFWLLKFKTL